MGQRNEFRLGLALLLSLVAASCGGGDGDDSGDQTVPSSVDIAESLSALAVDIGSRPAGTASENEAADFLANELSDLGYEVERQPFDISSLIYDKSLVRVGDELYEAYGMQGSEGLSTGPLVVAERGNIPEDVGGAIVLIGLADASGPEILDEAKAGGAAGIVVYNDEPGPLYVGIGRKDSMRAATVAGADAEVLLSAAERGEEATIELSGVETHESQNIIGRGSADCRLLITAHFDSVPASPGGNDNGSGTAVVLELAETLAMRGDTAGVCFVAFGAEELGLLGSRHFVEQLSDSESALIIAVLNIDTAGFDPRIFVTGDGRVEDVYFLNAQRMGLNLYRGQEPARGNSDHFPFLEAGIPAVHVASIESGPIHTADDTLEIVDTESLADITALSLRVISNLLDETKVSD